MKEALFVHNTKTKPRYDLSVESLETEQRRRGNL